MISKVLNVASKNKKAVLKIVIGGVSIVVSFFIVFNVDRAIKKMNLDYAGNINEYKRVLRDVENKFANEVLSASEKSQLEKARKHYIQKINEREPKAKDGGGDK